ncbi:LPXTG cell wall anchor domain-containing protein [Lactococcus lactis]|uniref:LPXTG cell wall anchor domain-containing protein n=1 Tax=Lactococcus lactis TaxID=1358 RepID=UPI00071E2B2F|nr:LPXTG cell wall anchor domain-containing protein [Lactococcus lactis]
MNSTIPTPVVIPSNSNGGSSSDNTGRVLPLTGEKSGMATAIIGIVLLTTAVGFVLFGRRKKN